MLSLLSLKVVCNKMPKYKVIDKIAFSFGKYNKYSMKTAVLSILVHSAFDNNTFAKA